MPTPSPSPQWCHLVWTTLRGRRWFKIAEAAAFCERAVRAACTARGWQPDLILALPDRIHALVKVPANVSRRAVSPPLQRHVTEALAAARFVPPHTRIWRGDGWCGLLASPGGLMVVRRQLAALATRPDRAPSASSRGAPDRAERARGIPARRITQLEWLEHP